jgi:UDP-glucose 4-epimerase
MPHVLITGGSGFFGSVLKQRLLAEDYQVTNIDLLADSCRHPNLKSIQGNICDRELMRQVFSSSGFSAVFHCAASLAHGSIDARSLWSSNVEGTRVIADCAREFEAKKLIFISTNCLWASNPGHPITEEEAPRPIEPYGHSKLAAETILAEYARDLSVIVLRSPTIIDSGRLGLLAILFEFVQEGRTVWVVGDGSNRYQFISAVDLASACLKALDYAGSDVFHVGSDHVPTLREVYEAVIRAAGSRSRVRSLPRLPATTAMQVAHKLKLSPLGPYHSQMIAEDFLFDTTKIKEALHWAPTLTNEEMMVDAYHYYASRRAEIHARQDASPHHRAAEMGIIRLLKWVS